VLSLFGLGLLALGGYFAMRENFALGAAAVLVGSTLLAVDTTG